MIVIVWIICIVAAVSIGASKSRVGLGFLLGLFLGIFGVLIIACVPASRDTEPMAQFGYALARGNTPLGRYPLGEINQMIGSQQLIESDYFFDDATNSWKRLGDLPGVLFPVRGNVGDA